MGNYGWVDPNTGEQLPIGVGGGTLIEMPSRYRGRAVNPQANALNQERINQGAQRIDLGERKLTEQTREHGEKMSLDQEAQLLRKAQLVFEVVKARQAIEDQRDSLTHAAAIIDQMGDLDTGSPTYEHDRAKILAAHAPGLGLAQPYVKQQDAIWESQAKLASGADAANQKVFYAKVAKRYGLTPDDLNAVSALAPGTVKYLDIAGNPVTAEASKGKESHLQAQFPVADDVVTMPLSDFQSVMRLHGEFSAPPPPPTKGFSRTPANAAALAQPASTPTPAQISTTDAASFLQSIGVPLQQSAPSASAPPVQAAQSGLPDQSEKSLAPETDEGY